MVSCIPRIGRRPAGIGRGGEVPVQVKSLRARAEGCLLVVRVIGSSRQCWWYIRSRERASGLDTVSRCIVGVVGISSGVIYPLTYSIAHTQDIDPSHGA